MKHKILIVEDDFISRLVMAKIFSNPPFEVQTAESGAVALMIMENFTPDLVITDYNMPEMNGQELLLEIRRLDEIRKVHTPVVLCTGSEYKPEAVWKEAGFNAVEHKPVIATVLFDKVNALLENK